MKRNRSIVTPFLLHPFLHLAKPLFVLPVMREFGGAKPCFLCFIWGPWYLGLFRVASQKWQRWTSRWGPGSWVRTLCSLFSVGNLSKALVLWNWNDRDIYKTGLLFRAHIYVHNEMKPICRSQYKPSLLFLEVAGGWRGWVVGAIGVEGEVYPVGRCLGETLCG